LRASLAQLFLFFCATSATNLAQLLDFLSATFWAITYEHFENLHHGRALAILGACHSDLQLTVISFFFQRPEPGR